MNLEDLEEDDPLCFCTGLTVEEVREAILAGNDTVEAVGEALGAGTHCGGCKGRIQELIDLCK